MPTHSGRSALAKVMVAVAAMMAGGEARALTVYDATFQEEYLINTTAGPEYGAGVSDAVPENIAGDATGSYWDQAVVAVNMTGGPVPMVDIQSSTSVSQVSGNASVASNGVITYYFGIARKSDPNAVGGDPVPIRVTARGSVFITAPANEFDDQIGGLVWGRITAYLGAGGVTIGFNSLTIGTYTGCFSRPGCVVQQRIDPEVTGTAMATPGLVYSGYVRAEIRNDAYPMRGPYEVQAIADPLIEFVDPADAELYDIVYSPNLSTLPTVPLLGGWSRAGLVMLVVALGNLGLLRRSPTR